MRCWLLLVFAGCGFDPHSAELLDGAIAGGSDAAMPPDAPAVQPPTSPRTLTVQLDNTSELANVRLLVALDNTRVDYSQIPDSTTGFTFKDAGGNVLDYDVDHWDPAGRSALWVLVPVVAANTTTTLTMAWGTGMHAANTATVWTDYEQTLHFEAPIVDASGAYYAPTANSITEMTGMIGQAAAFSGSSAQITFANGSGLYNSWTAFTLELWLYLDYAPGALDGMTVGMLDRGGPLQAGRIDANGHPPELIIDWHFAAGELSMPIPIPLQQWTHVAYTYNGFTLATYANGAMIDSQEPSGLLDALAFDGNLDDKFFLGSSTTPAFSGSFDELEVEQDGHPADPVSWIRGQYLSQSDQAITFGP